MKKLVKKSTGGSSNDKLKRAQQDSTNAANYEKSKAYGSATSAMKKVVELKKSSPAAVRSGKPEPKYGSTPVSKISLKKKGGAVKSKKK